MITTKIDTSGMTREEWLQSRTRGIGGSDAAAILGLNPYKSPLSVYLDKIGENPIEEINNQYIEWGNRLEEPIAQCFQDRHKAEGMKVVKDNYMYISDTHPFMLANLDREIWNSDGSIDGLEIKTTSQNNKEKWMNGKAPMHYLVQVQHYLAVRPDLDKFYLVCLIGGNEYIELTVLRNSDMIQTLHDVEADFWGKVERREPPEYNGSESDKMLLNSMLPKSNKGEIIDLTFTHMDKAIIYSNLDNKIAELKQQAKLLETEREAAKQEIMAAMGTAEKAVIGQYSVKFPTVTTKGHWVQDSVYRRFTLK